MDKCAAKKRHKRGSKIAQKDDASCGGLEWHHNILSIVNDLQVVDWSHSVTSNGVFVVVRCQQTKHGISPIPSCELFDGKLLGRSSETYPIAALGCLLFPGWY